MKNKFFTLLSLSVLALVLMLSLVSAESSAVFTITDVNAPSNVDYDEDSFTFTFTLTYTGPSEDMEITFDDSIASIGDISIPKEEHMDGTIVDGDSRTVTGTIDNFAGNPGETIEVVIEATTGSSTDDETTFSVSINDVPEEVNACAITANDAGSDNDDLQLSIEDVKVTGFGDEYEWFPLDEVEVEINVENDNDDYKMKDVTVGWGLYDLDAGKWYYDDEESDFKLSDGDDKTLYVTLNLDDDVDKLEEGDYIFYVWANAELDADSGDVKLCASAYEEVEIIVEDDFVILAEIDFPENAEAGDEVVITAEVWNIGSKDQDDVYALIYNSDLNIREQMTIGNINAFDSEDLSVTITIPEDAEEMSYTFSFFALDEDEEIYENDYDDEQSVIYRTIAIERNYPATTISANLESDAKENRDLIVRLTITNTGSETGTFDVTLIGYETWASLVSVVPEKVILEAGEAEDVLVTLHANSDSAGEQGFNVVISEDSKVLTQPVSVIIEEGGFSFNLTGGMISEANWPIWTIGAINLVLVFIIIVVAIRISRK